MMEQGSPEWQRIRLGKVTASRAHRLMTPATMEYSAQAKTLIADLLIEKMLGRIDPSEYADRDVPIIGPSGMFMARGSDMEAEAVDWYSLHKMVDVDRPGFIADGDVGCSPDGLIREDGGLEIKCRSAVKHLEVVLGFAPVLADPLQVQFSLWVTGREWWDALAYNPELPKVIERHRPVPLMHKAFDECMTQFREDFAKAEALLEGITGDCIDRDNLVDVLRASIMAGKASEPKGTKSKKGEGRLSPAETKELHADLSAAKAAGALDDSDIAQVMQDAETGAWDDVRTMWAHAIRATNIQLVEG